MKKVLGAAVAMALLGPVAAQASPAAKALSLKSAAVKPVRAAAAPGKAAAGEEEGGLFSTFTVFTVLGAALVTALVLTGGDDSR